VTGQTTSRAGFRRIVEFWNVCRCGVYVCLRYGFGLYEQIVL